jgi:hypothetical protein
MYGGSVKKRVGGTTGGRRVYFLSYLTGKIACKA